MRANLIRLAQATGRPAAILLQESGRGSGWTIPGYQQFSAPVELGPQDHDQNRILIREGALILDDGWLEVPDGEWVWKGNQRAPRIYPWVAFRWEGHVFVAVSVHRIPLGPRPSRPKNRNAWDAEHRALITLTEDLSSRWPEATVVLGGDWNAGLGEMPEYRYSLRGLAESIEASGLGVVGIDGFVVVNGAIVEVRKLEDKFGSDAHRPVEAVVWELR